MLCAAAAEKTLAAVDLWRLTGRRRPRTYPIAAALVVLGRDAVCAEHCFPKAENGVVSCTRRSGMRKPLARQNGQRKHQS
eukprot:1318012-Rhodomonas_salina.1